jgi:transglutaminase-like putative cysteine protease
MIVALKRLAVILVAIHILGAATLYLYTLPALRRLPKAKERSLNGITTIDDAVRYLHNTGKTGWELVVAAQKLVNAKMEYSRRNGWDTPSHAFRRGMGYCQQQATALLIILRKLGIEARRAGISLPISTSHHPRLSRPQRSLRAHVVGRHDRRP